MSHLELLHPNEEICRCDIVHASLCSFDFSPYQALKYSLSVLRNIASEYMVGGLLYDTIMCSAYAYMLRYMHVGLSLKL